LFLLELGSLKATLLYIMIELEKQKNNETRK